MKRFLCGVPAAILLLFGFCPGAVAHEVRPAYLQLRETSPGTYEVLWKVPARGDNLRLALYVELPTGTLELTRPRADFTGGSYLERWAVQRTGGMAGGIIRIAGLSATMTDVLVRLERQDGSTQMARLTPSDPEFVVQASPSTTQVAATYLKLGVEHILLGVDHLLFVLALLILVRGVRMLIATVTAFTVAHSLTLAGATLGWVHVPGPPVEACIALSILFVAVEIIRVREEQDSLTARRPWLAAFAFGLLHGFGFAGALSEIGVPEHAVPAALLFFNVGVELGQILFITAVLALISVATWLRVPAPSWGWRIAPYTIGSAAAFWLMERISAF
jgi:hydrogenase/urease accessory protein HupE